MERPIDNIDELLRQRLNNAEVPPPPFVWPNVERSLRRRKRRFLVWFLALGLACAGIWTVWSRPFPSTAEKPGRSTRPVQPLEKTPPRAALPAMPATGGARQPANAETTAAPATTETSSRRTAATSSGHKSVGKSGTTRSYTHQVEEQQLMEVDVEKSGVPRSYTRKNPLPDALTHTNTVDVIAPAVDVAGADGSTGVSAVHTPIGVSSPAVSSLMETPDLLPARISTLEAWRRQEAMNRVKPRVNKRKTAKKCYDFHANRQAWLLDAYAGPSFVRKTLSTGNPEFRDYVEDRLSTEHREVAFNAGIRASYLFAENFIVRTGLHYDQFTEKFEYIDPNYIKYTVEIKQDLVNGQWVTVTDTVKIEYGANYVKTYNRFALLDIPLQAALELRSGPTGISLNLGGSVNVLFRKRGSMLDLNGQPVSFTPDKQKFDVFQSRVGFSLMGSIQWYYHLNPKTRFFAEPYYRYILNPVTKPGYPVKQSYGIAGVRLGVTKILDIE